MPEQTSQAEKAWVRFSQFYHEKGRLGIAVSAFVSMIVSVTAPDRAQPLLAKVLGGFVIIALIELVLLNRRLEELHKNVRDAASRSTIHTFKKATEFDNYLAARLNKAKQVNVLHMSPRVSSQLVGRRYHEILNEFIRKGGTLRRIYCNTGDDAVRDWIKKELQDTEGTDNKYIVHYLESVTVEQVDLMAFMVIDSKDVCVGVSHESQPRTAIAIEGNKVVASIFGDYFNHLMGHSKPIKTTSTVNWMAFNASYRSPPSK